MRRAEPTSLRGTLAVIAPSLIFLVVGILLFAVDGWPRLMGLVFGLWGLMGMVQGAMFLLRSKRTQ